MTRPTAPANRIEQTTERRGRGTQRRSRRGSRGSRRRTRSTRRKRRGEERRGGGKRASERGSKRISCHSTSAAAAAALARSQIGKGPLYDTTREPRKTEGSKSSWGLYSNSGYSGGLVEHRRSACLT
ncbi:hypothetical protein AXG93_3384s1020 [Marchantia polymorpha subsp. ruderalis]|uniref:Uncharacterized protein n=1 Tax=Marchantia polymorpha subsp. ruderalis TaxID=1480154 RepID=A0A176WEF3_MARPO|nr:hypothetical protein AXG93_3384s1020 [Marchantia polymorpha subsp. ruderalis]